MRSCPPELKQREQINQHDGGDAANGLQPVRYTRMGFTPAECAGQGTFEPYDPVHIGSLSAPPSVGHCYGGPAPDSEKPAQIRNAALDCRAYALAAKIITPLVAILAADRLPDFMILWPLEAAQVE